MKFLSYNIQAGIGTVKASQYFTGAYRQLINDARKSDTLTDIANYIRHYDVVCLQEVDLGGFRAGYLNQAEYIQELAGFPHMATQINRRIGRLSVHGNIILSRRPITHQQDYKLPGTVSGRGLLVADIGIRNPIVIANTHFSLGERAQHSQFDFVQKTIGHREKVILAGDFNCAHDSRPLRLFDAGSDLDLVTEKHHYGFPSWNPSRAIDHIFVSKSFGPTTCKVGNVRYSDHLPLDLRLDI
ncbi:MAG: endonuclease [Acidimicrobiales bacterium]|nr:endonuclease [Hyphomonadaceae bacterium]RZV43113.1 MAG: endonuclease [Acidimicrobiales bacterium]